MWYGTLAIHIRAWPVADGLTSTHLPTHGLAPAHPSRPTVAMMKMKTTASSFLESLSKHVQLELDCYGDQVHRELTKTCGEYILHASLLTDWEIVV